ncbi:MAG: hypothetical protein ACFE9T_16255 [Promethearchaeota archaeon]
MKKKNIGYILFGVAGIELLSMLMSLIIFPRIYEQQDMPERLSRFAITSILTVSIVVSIILVVVGIILLIKFRKE